MGVTKCFLIEFKAHSQKNKLMLVTKNHNLSLASENLIICWWVNTVLNCPLLPQTVAHLSSLIIYVSFYSKLWLMQRSITISKQKLVCLIIKLLVELVLSIMKYFNYNFYPSVIHFYVMYTCSCVDMYACMSLSCEAKV